MVGDCDPTLGKVKKKRDPVVLLVSGMSAKYTLFWIPATVKADVLILYPLILLIWKEFPNPIWYSANVSVTTLRSLLMDTVVIFDVTDSWLSSTVFKNLLYLNLAPYLFNSLDSEYFVTLFWTSDDTNVADGARLVL